MTHGGISDHGIVSLTLFRPDHEPVCLRRRSLDQWVLRQLGSIDHELRVARIATELFDLIWPLHGLTREDRRLLEFGAILHDVGRCVDDDTHPQEGARLIRETAELPLRAAERRALAYLTRYHRGKVPAAGADEILRREDDPHKLRMVLALLRSADALDSRVIDSPRLRFELVGRRLQITCLLQQDSPKARKVYGRRKKHRLLEEVCDCEVEVRITAARALRLAA